MDSVVIAEATIKLTMDFVYEETDFDGKMGLVLNHSNIESPFSDEKAKSLLNMVISYLRSISSINIKNWYQEINGFRISNRFRF